LRLGLRKAKETKVNLGWHKDRKDKPISAPSIHVGGCWFIWVNSLGLFNDTLLLWTSNISIVLSLAHIILYDDIIVAETLFFVFFKKGRYSTQKKRKQPFSQDQGVKNPFHFDRVTKNTSSFNLFFPVFGRSLRLCCKTTLHMLYKVTPGLRCNH